MPDFDSVARWGTGRVVLEVVQAQHGTDAIAQRPVLGHASVTHLAPVDYAVGVAAARLVAGYANRLANEYARKARGDGRSWGEIAEALGIPDGADFVAFEAVAGDPRNPFDPRWVSWRCATCGELVTDNGPYNGHPDDDESGHADICARHLAEVAAYERKVDR